MTLKSDSSSSPASLDWKFSQVFGDKIPSEDVQNVDIISAVEFDRSGNHLAVGDRGGRVVIFEKDGGKNDAIELASRLELERLDSVVSKHPKFQYKTEFQSHEPEFDSLKSVEISEKVNKVRWSIPHNESLFLLSTNEKTIKFWMVKEDKVKKVTEIDMTQNVTSENSLLADKSLRNEQNPHLSDGNSLELTDNMDNGLPSYGGGIKKIAYWEDAYRARCRRVYGHAHDFNVHSISINSDCETFISGDDLRINLWNLAVSDQCFNIVDIKPDNMDDLTEVITAAEFHPFHCNLLGYSSTRGFIRLVDMRQSALCDHNARILKDEESNGVKSFFTELMGSMSDMKFANDGRHILTRDYMNLKLWDMHMESGPVATYRVHEDLRPKLSELYNNDAIFDKFDCCLAGDSLNFATGSYSNLLRVFSFGSGSGEGATIETTKTPNRKQNVQSSTRARRSSLSNLARGIYHRQASENPNSGGAEYCYDFNSKPLHLAWHPKADLIACAAGSNLLMYYAS